MAKIYASLIAKGAICPKTGNAWTLEDVPAKLRKEVEEILNPKEA